MDTAAASGAHTNSCKSPRVPSFPEAVSQLDDVGEYIRFTATTMIISMRSYAISTSRTHFRDAVFPPRVDGEDWSGSLYAELASRAKAGLDETKEGLLLSLRASCW